ncbi:MAG: adenine deaminase, partial [Oscillibacter sp.]|nr:adenine deaminase [Oscillibacter sp.]
DKHPDDLLEKGHIDYIIKRAIALGADPVTAVKVGSLNAARYFRLDDRGAIAPGYLADLVLIDDFARFNVLRVYKNGVLMAEGGRAADFPAPRIDPELMEQAHRTLHLGTLTAEDFTERRPRGIIGMVGGEIMTEDAGYSDRIDTEYDVLKIAVAERHNNTHHVGIGFLHGYGLKSGAVATSISHDSHNIIVVGTNEADMAAAVNRVTAMNGGIVVTENGRSLAEVPLAIAGIMSDEPLGVVNEKLNRAREQAHALGVNREIDPFMTLSFMALPVIPALRITTRGIFDVTTQSYV